MGLHFLIGLLHLSIYLGLTFLLNKKESDF